jgi:signal transduction histidine kinase
MQAKRVSASQSPSRRFTPNLLDLRFYVWIILLHVLLFYPLVPLLTEAGQPRAKQLAVVILVLVFALAHWLVMFRQPAWRTRVDRMLPFLLANLALAAVLTWLDPSYAFLFLFAAGYAFRFLPIRWAVLVGLLTAAIVIGEQLGPFLKSSPPESLLQPLAGQFWLLFGILFVAWLAQFARQARERQALLEQLQATQGELVSAERQAGILEERARLAREIHDTLAQGLVSIVMHLQAAEQTLPDNDSAASQHLDQARRAARENLAEARRFVWALQPEALEREALPKAVTRAAQHWSEENHIPVAMSVTGNPCTLPPEYEVTLLRAAQEALANVGKHAHARHVTLTLSYMDDQLMMDVNDDGIGFDTTQINSDRESNSFGLAGMRQRVERLGGHLAIESAEGEGTTLVIEIPIVASGEKS